MEDDSLSDLSSELSSVGSLSPPPQDYPSPVSSQEPDIAGPNGQKPGNKRPLEDNAAPPAKKRRKIEPKPRTTEHLDLTTSYDSSEDEQKKQLDLLLKVLRKRRKIVVIAGAGISVSAGSRFGDTQT